MEITIRGKKLELKYTIRAMFIFEQIKGTIFKIETLTDDFIFFYSLLLANNKEKTLPFDELIDEIDNDPKLMEQYRSFCSEEMKKQSIYKHDEATDDKKKDSL